MPHGSSKRGVIGARPRGRKVLTSGVSRDSSGRVGHGRQLEGHVPHIGGSVYLPHDGVGDALHVVELLPTHPNYRDASADLGHELLVLVVEPAQVLKRDARLASTGPHHDALVAGLGAAVEVHDRRGAARQCSTS